MPRVRKTYTIKEKEEAPKQAITFETKTNNHSSLLFARFLSGLAKAQHFSFFSPFNHISI